MLVIFYVIENVMAFAWEPTGNRFAFIHGESPRICVSFYNLMYKVKKTTFYSSIWRQSSATQKPENSKICLSVCIQNKFYLGDRH
jgi:uncharacterized protein with WD repeat